MFKRTIKTAITTLLFAFCLQVFALPDLNVTLVQSDFIEVPPPGEGGIEVFFVIVNSGDAPANNFTIEAYAAQAQSCSVNQGQRFLDRTNITTLPAGHFIEGSFILDSRPGEDRVFDRVRADVFNTVTENSEGNNCRGSFSKTVAYPDLRIESTQGPTPNRFIAGEPGADFKVTIWNAERNIGDWPAGPSTLGHFASTATSNPPESDRLLKLDQPTPALDINEEAELITTIQIPKGTPNGTYRLFGKTDADNKVSEGLRENNNFSAGRTIEVVDLCTFTDFNENGTVDVLDLAAVVNQLGNTLYLANYHLNVKKSHAPFPEIINRLDLLAALGCWANRPQETIIGGTLQDISVIATQGQWGIAAQLSGNVSSIETMLLLPAGVAYGFGNSQYDLLNSQFLETRNPGGNRRQIYTQNTFPSYNNTFKSFASGQYVATTFNLQQIMDPTQLLPLGPDEPFTSGIAVQVVFADGSTQIMRKKFDYLHAPDDQFRNFIHAGLGIPQSQAIPLDAVRFLTGINLDNTNITDLTGLEAFTNLTSLSVAHNNIERVPDLTHLSGLHTLNLSHNQIYRLPELPGSLEVLDVSHNELWDLPNMDHLVALETLDISHNRLTELPAMQALNSLDTLIANHARLSALPALPASLRDLEVEHNQLTRLPSFNGVLTSVMLRNNFISDASNLTTGIGTGTAEIRLDHNNLDARFCNLKRLILKQTRGNLQTFTFSDQLQADGYCNVGIALGN